MPRSPKLRCSRCGRAFKLPAHLGRHMKAVHRSQPTAGRRVKRSHVPGAKRRRAKAQRSAASLTGGLNAVLGSLRSAQTALTAQRAQVDRQIEAIDRALGALNTSPVSRPTMGRRAVAGALRRGSLKDHIQRVLRARRSPMQVKDITQRVLDAGFKTKNKTLDKSVGNALAEMRQVQKVERGVFRLK